MENYQEIATISDEPRFGDITIMINKNQPNLKAMKKQKICKDQYEFYQQVKEIEIRRQIKHPNIMLILGHEINKEKRVTSVFYEFPEKQLKISKINKNQIMYFFRDILQGLIYLNSKKMIHGDLRPKYFFFDSENQIYKIADRLNSADPPLQTQMKNVYSFKPLYITNMLFNDLINKKKRVKLRPIKNEIFALGIVTLESFMKESEIQKLYDYDKKIFRQDLFEDQMDYLIQQEPDFYLKLFLQYLKDDILLMDDSQIDKQSLLQKIQTIIQNKEQRTSLLQQSQFELSPDQSQKQEINFSLSSSGNVSNNLNFSPFIDKNFLKTATFNNSSIKQFMFFKKTNKDNKDKNKFLQITMKLESVKKNSKKVKIQKEFSKQINLNMTLYNNIKVPSINNNISSLNILDKIEEQFSILGQNFYQKQCNEEIIDTKNTDDKLNQFQQFLFTIEKQKNTPKKTRQSLKLKDYLKKSPIVSERQISKQSNKNPPQKEIVRSFSYAKLQAEKNKKTKKKLQRNQSQILYNCCLQKKFTEAQPKNMKQSTVLDNISQMSLFIRKKKKKNKQNNHQQVRDVCIKEPRPNKIDKCNQETPYAIILNDINLKIELKELNLIDIFKKKTLNKRKKSQQIIKLQRQQTLQYDEDIYTPKNTDQYSSNKNSLSRRTSQNRQLNPARYRFNFDHDEFRPTIQTHENNYNRSNQPYYNEVNNDIISLETITFKNHLNSVKKDKKIYSKNNSPLNTKQSNNHMSNSVLPDIPVQFKRNIRNLRKKNKIRDSQLEKLHEDSSCNLDEFKKMGIKALVTNSQKDI